MNDGNDFDIISNRPLCISCGHTICKICVNKLYTGNTITCPIDKKRIAVNSNFKNESFVFYCLLETYFFIL